MVENYPLNIPDTHGQAHESLSTAPCEHNHGWQGCNFIDAIKAGIGLTGEEHQTALIEAAWAVSNRVCKVCPLVEWAEVKMVKV